MLYISAQPDDIYFIWQLEILLRNLRELGVTMRKTHILVGYKRNIGLNPVFKAFIDENKDLAEFYCYPDTRKNPQYVSSIRPHILKKHFNKYPELSNAIFMYHDSDILFSRIPQILPDNKCYVSDTRSYLDVNYILKCSSEDLLNEMLDVVGLSREKLKFENHNTGGAQYILKGITSKFWEKVESDCEKLFSIMTAYNFNLWDREYKSKKELRNNRRGIHAWCADMWAILWNLWFFGHEVKIHPELAFNWPFSPSKLWNSRTILHYTGGIGDGSLYFKKSNYINYFPWYDENLDSISKDSCSYFVAQHIKKRRFELDNSRPTFKNSIIILKCKLPTMETDILFSTYKKYIQKYLDITVVHIIDVCETEFIDEKIPRRENLTSITSRFSTYLIIPLDQLLDSEQILLILNDMTIDKALIPMGGYVLDALFIKLFSNLLDTRFFDENKGKFQLTSETLPILHLGTRNMELYLNDEASLFGLEKQNFGCVYKLN